MTRSNYHDSEETQFLQKHLSQWKNNIDNSNDTAHDNVVCLKEIIWQVCQISSQKKSKKIDCENL